MNRRIEKLIPKAIKSAERHLANQSVIRSEYNGYISSFGAAILQSGLQAAIAFNENTSSSSKEDRRPLMRAILEIVTNREIPKNSDEKLLDYVLTPGNEVSEIKARIMNAAVALKLAIRTFELRKGDES